MTCRASSPPAATTSRGCSGALPDPTVRGTPCLTYGTEMALTGQSEDEVRGDMVFNFNDAPIRGCAPGLRAGAHLALRPPASPSPDRRRDPHPVADASRARLRPRPRNEAVVVALNFGDHAFPVDLPQPRCGHEGGHPGRRRCLPIRRSSCAPRDTCSIAHGLDQRQRVPSPRSARRPRPPVISGCAAAPQPRARSSPWASAPSSVTGVRSARGPLRTDAAVRLTLPAGGVFELKLVARRDAGPFGRAATTAICSCNRGTEPLRVDLAWDEPHPR